MVNGTLRWPVEEIYITNCFGAQKLNLGQLCLLCVYVFICAVVAWFVCGILFMPLFWGALALSWSKDAWSFISTVSFVLVCMPLSTDTQTVRRTHTWISVNPVPLRESSSNKSHSKHEACVVTDHIRPFSFLFLSVTRTHTITVINVFTSTSFSRVKDFKLT